MNTAFLNSFDALKRIYDDGAYSTAQLNDTLRTCTAKDKALITKLVYGVLDNDIRLQYIIGRHVAKMPKGDALLFLKIGTYCLSDLSIPPYAVVNDVAELAKTSGDRRIVGFVNATLKSIAANVGKEPLPDDPIESLSVRYSYPMWALKKLIKDYGLQQAREIVSAVPDTRTVVRFVKPTTVQQAKDKFGCDVSPTLFDDAFRVDGRVGQLDDTFTVQSLSSMAISRICAAFKPRNVLDVCSAPGGKAVYLKQLCPDAHVTACDIHPHRVALIDSYAGRMGVSIDTMVADGTQPDENLIGKFDLVLCDVPCSGFGVLDNHPDIKVFRTEKDISDIMKVQRAILANACRYVAKGGHLVYSTCTVFEHENGQQIKRFLAEHDDFVPVAITLPELPTANGQTQYRFVPDDGMQGFFVAALQKL